MKDFPSSGKASNHTGLLFSFLPLQKACLHSMSHYPPLAIISAPESSTQLPRSAHAAWQMFKALPSSTFSLPLWKFSSSHPCPRPLDPCLPHPFFSAFSSTAHTCWPTMLPVLTEQLGWGMSSGDQLKALELYPHLSVEVWAPPEFPTVRSP